MESWGRGIDKILSECRAYGTPAPVFDTSLSGLMVTLKAAPVETPVETRTKTPERILSALARNPELTLGACRPQERRTLGGFEVSAIAALQLLQPLQRSQQRGILLGKAKAHHALVKAVAVKGRQRNGGHTDLAGQPLAKIGLAEIAHL